MRFIIALCAAIVASVTVVSAGVPTFTLCDTDGAILQNVKIESNAWTSNGQAKITISGDVTQAFGQGATSHSVSFFDDIAVDDSKVDLCSYKDDNGVTPVQCPVGTGQHAFVFQQKVPEVPWPGTVTARSEWKTGDGQKILCYDTKVRL